LAAAVVSDRAQARGGGLSARIGPDADLRGHRKRRPDPRARGYEV